MRKLALLPFVVLMLAACSAETTPATNITSTSASLNASIQTSTSDASANGPNCYGWFAYSVFPDPNSPSDWLTTSPAGGPCGNYSGPFAAEVQNLQPGMTYYYAVCGLPGQASPPTPSYNPVFCADSTGTVGGTNFSKFTTPYYQDALNGSFAMKWWFWGSDNNNHGPNGLLTWASDGSGHQAMRLWDCGTTGTATMGQSTTCNNGETWGSGGNYGQAAIAYLPACQGNDAHADTPANCPANSAGHDENDWYRFKVRFPAGYQPTPGSQNLIFETHLDGPTQWDANALNPTPNCTGNCAAYSFGMAVDSDPPPGQSFAQVCGNSWPPTPYYCKSPGVNPRFGLQITGGSDGVPAGGSNGCSATEPVTHCIASAAFQTGHWYDMVLHVHWSTDAAVGQVQWWVDGVEQIPSGGITRPTLYTRQGNCPNPSNNNQPSCTPGSASYNTDVAFADYRLWAPWDANVDFEDLQVGPNAQSVGFSG